MDRYQLTVYCKDCAGEDEYGCFDGGVESWGTFETLEECQRIVDEADMPLWCFTVYDGLKDESFELY